MRLVSVLFFLFIANLTLSINAQTIPADCEPHPTAAALLCADIAYGDDERQTLDVYLPLDDTEPETIVVIVHGGGYSTGGKAVADIIDMAELLAIHGYGAVSVGYRLQPDHPFPAQVQDAFCGVGWIQETFAPENLLILGYSAGGLTASILGAADDPTTYLQEDCAYTLPDAPFLAGTIALYAPSDVSSTGYPYRGDLIPAEEDDDFLQQYSPLYLVDGSEAPFLLLHGVDDAIVPASESENLAAALEDAEVIVNLRLIEDAGHDTFTWDEDQFFMAMADILTFIQTVTTPGGEPI
jgi:acetyl esterase/lipase